MTVEFAYVSVQCLRGAHPDCPGVNLDGGVCECPTCGHELKGVGDPDA